MTPCPATQGERELESGAVSEQRPALKNGPWLWAGGGITCGMRAGELRILDCKQPSLSFLWHAQTLPVISTLQKKGRSGINVLPLVGTDHLQSQLIPAGGVSGALRWVGAEMVAACSSLQWEHPAGFGITHGLGLRSCSSRRGDALSSGGSVGEGSEHLELVSPLHR